MRSVTLSGLRDKGVGSVYSLCFGSYYPAGLLEDKHPLVDNVLRPRPQC